MFIRNKSFDRGRWFHALIVAAACALAGPGALAQTQVQNTANINLSGGLVDPSPGNNTFTVTTDVVAPPAVTYSKSASTAGPVKVGDTLTYTLSTVVTNSATTAVVTLTDTLGTGLTFGSVTNAGAYTCNATNPLECTLPAGTVPGTYTVTYTATVNDQATGSVRNAVVGTGTDNPGCTSNCGTDTPVTPSAVTYSKSASTAGPVKVGDTLTYTLSTVVTNSATTAVVTLTDTLGTGLTFGSVTSAGAYTCNATNPLECTLPAGTVPGTYPVTYTATVNDQATGSVRNAVVGTGTDNPGCTSNCGTDTPVVTPEPPMAVNDTETAEAGSPVTVDIINNDDGNGSGLDPTSITLVNPSGNGQLSSDGKTLEVPGEGTWTVGGNGTVTFTPELGFVGNPAPIHYTVKNLLGMVSNVAVVTIDVPVVQTLRVSKLASPRDVKVGDLVRYTVTVENMGTLPVVDAMLIDTPPAGFTFVDGSLTVADRDNAGRLVGTYPIQVDQIDIAVDGRATFAYLLRVGAGVRPGIHTNSAYMRDNGRPVSNTATAEVQAIADPLIDQTLILGTVFDDRDGDGWQDSAAMTDVKVRGGFAPEAYVANSTTVDRGDGAAPEPDASSPMLHGIGLGEIGGRQSDADPVDPHAVVIRQRLNALNFNDDFALTTAQGVTVRMDASGATRIERSGDAAKGLTAAAPSVERRVNQSEGGYVVDYVIRNTGVDEHGIPGVRIGSVEGLLIETDPFGRYHLAGVDAGRDSRGRNFILKVDPASLPPGSEFTTDNPLTRRVTPGLPVRFDWGVKLPGGLIEGREETVEVELGEVFFAPGSAQVRDPYLAAIEKMAARVAEHRGGEVVIAANADSRALAVDRAEAVKDELLKRLPADAAKALKVSVRGNADDPSSLIVGFDEGGALLGTVLFDTDKSTIRPEFEPLLDKVAAALERMNGGVIAVVGHTDVRGSHAYNVALGMRRATAVYEALAKRLNPEVRAKVRVESSNDPTAPVDVKRN